MTSSVEDTPPYYHSENVSDFLRLLQEATRARPDGAQSTYIAPVNADKTLADYHHIVFGQRGSGKSTLLRKLWKDQAAEGRLSVWIDQEIFADLAFPDVLVSTVEAVIDGASDAVAAKIQLQRGLIPRWRRWLFRAPKDFARLNAELKLANNNFSKLRFAPNESTIEWTRAEKSNSSFNAGGAISIKPVTLSAGGSSAQESAVQSKETVIGSKGEYLERILPDLRRVLRAAAEITGGGFVFLDDVYQLDRMDQPKVLGYVHRLLKDSGFWIKIGSIRYLTTTYTSASRPVGMQSGHDAHLIALDDGMQQLGTSSTWLREILEGIAPRANIDIQLLFNEGSLERTALASGCIARDYLTIAGAAIEEARNREPTHKAGFHRVTVEDVNRAAAVLSPAKLDDMQQDAPEEAARSRVIINELTAFCRKTKRAYFLIDASDRDLSDRMEALRHLRFVHLLYRSETMKTQASERYDVWLLDLSQLAVARATQRIDFNGWQDRDKRRNRNLIFQSTAVSDS